MLFRDLVQKRPDILKEYMYQFRRYYLIEMDQKILDHGFIGIVPGEKTDQGDLVWLEVSLGNYSLFDEWVSNTLRRLVYIVEKRVVEEADSHLDAVCSKGVHENELVDPEWSNGYNTGVKKALLILKKV